ncbi:MAG TPA: YicC/YloC family endoribonuclease [Solimonas sp.]|nr:YicC/YloC family endoribonuclease [Solimonas sp.]
MIRSMTGYARAEVQKGWGRLSWELRSVNHRYLDLQFKMPEEFRSLENELRVMAGARLSRGKVECGLRYSRETGDDESLQLDLGRLRQLREAMDAVGHECGPLTATDPIRILSFPGVLRQEQADFAPMLAESKRLFEAALDDFTQTRGREGERLGQFLAERTTALAGLVAKVRERHPQVRDQWLQKLRARCNELGVEIEPQRLGQEMALAAQRLDVEEEMSRLLSHLEEVKQACARGESVGRRLDFLMQELNREANTLSSKSQDAEITRCAVEMKVIIEQMREQVQNIE